MMHRESLTNKRCPLALRKQKEREMETKKHFVLVHGAGHGAWCWYKLAPLLKFAGHHVHTLDLGASGVDSKQLNELDSIYDYAHRLMDFVDSLDERVILVGHSFGGYIISLAMENFPEKILTAVFVGANMPSWIDPPATIQQEFFKWTSTESLLDCEIIFDGEQGNLPISTTVGPHYLETVMYKNCQPEDLELAKALIRPFKFFLKDLGKESLLTESKYGSVNRVFVICKEDAVMKEEFQQWMIENCPLKEVKVISRAGHMVMLSQPTELYQCLQDIAEKW